jgi:carboxyl-terminal processing protease
MIPSSRFSVYPDMNEAIVNKLRGKYQDRLKTDVDLKKMVLDLDRWKKAKEKKTISLKEDKRRKEIDEQKKKNTVDVLEDGTIEKADVAEEKSKAVMPTDSISIVNAKIKAQKEKQEKDTFLKESERILTDYILLKK